ncbi:MAG: SPASM domain-containing protein [Chlorobiaceae bacterium]|nr:SPASM domain-containing protein [Chlorobiaceae bacterium]
MSGDDKLHCFSFGQQHFAINANTMIASRICSESASYLSGNQSHKAYDALSVTAKSELDALYQGHKTLKGKNVSTPSISDDPEGKSSAQAGWDGRISCIALFVTQICNLRCTYCYGGAGEYGNRGVMDETTALRAVDWLLEHCGPHEGRISFFGGEPFLNFPLMKKVAEYARHQAGKQGVRMNFTVTTNLTLLDREKLDFIHDFDVMTIASFDGPKEIFDALRPSLDDSSSYDKAMKMLPELLAERGRMVNARATLVPGSDPAAVQTAINAAGFLRSTMVRAARSPYSDFSDIERDKAFSEKRLAFTSSNLRLFLDALKNRDEAQIGRLSKTLGISLPTRDVFLSRNRVFLGRKKYKCGVGRNYVAVSITGDIYPCHRFTGQENYRLGSIFSEQPIKPDFYLPPVDAAEKCRSCWTRYLCGGNCLHENVCETGDIRIPCDRMCDYEKQKNEMQIALWCSISNDDYQWLEQCRVISADECKLDFG